MRIECTTTFLDGRERFEKGDIFTVPDADAAYFIGNKWAKEVGAPDPEPNPAEPATLDVQGVSHKQKAVTRG
jgi:hypothetical protein